MTGVNPDKSGPQGFDERPRPVADDEQWRRPADGTPSLSPPTPAPARDSTPYAGPPPTTPPPTGWRPPLVVQAPPPRALPPQDLPRLDEAEERARTLTYGVAMVAGAIMLVLMLVLCGRSLF